MSTYTFMGGFFAIFPIIFILMFLCFFGLFIYTIIKKIKENRRNDASPVLSVYAVVVTKRMDVRHHNSANNMHHSHTTYYVTFEVESGDRIEFVVPDREYGMMVENDKGSLTFQGTRFLSFERE